LPQRLASSTCKSLISDGLMQIYHDSMENALSCWLNETTCPYSISSSSRHNRPNILKSMTEEWGPNWSNRICSRVCRLDRVASTTRDRPLTKMEDKAASRALQAVIMSFATQWAQSSQRSEREYSSFVKFEGVAYGSQLNGFSPEEPAFDEPDIALSVPTEFDRLMQESSWYRARQALQETAGIQSFRVIFAHIIFSLTQKPLKNSIADELDDVVQSDGPPLFLEIALRQLHSYRFKLDTWEREKGMLRRDANCTQTQRDPLNADDRKTFDMLFWLGVMFDTLSSAIHKRPLVISDEDSDVIPELASDPSAMNGYEEEFDNEIAYGSSLTQGSNLWGQFFFQQKRTQDRESIVRWPCPYEKAAAALSDAAPIKVLLFRKVSHLQILLSRRARHSSFEEGISAALRVYQHWNDAYGPFMLDCIANHDALPPRIQSWYIVLAGHWHLGAMLLADMIEFIDKAELSLTSRRQRRQSSHLVTRLHIKNAYAVADLGRCSCPRSNASFPNFREFHFAVNKGALLTEPWTVVLIRSFAKAAILLLDLMTQNHQKLGEHDEREQNKARCEYCIEALWNLGKKSDMAYIAATALSTAL
ncbi:uncharacterized protein LY89DRAFT_563837, partial [Mollisia scopiformis]